MFGLNNSSEDEVLLDASGENGMQMAVPVGNGWYEFGRHWHDPVGEIMDVSYAGSMSGLRSCRSGIISSFINFVDIGLS